MDELDDTLRAQVMREPRIRFVCERDWCHGPHTIAVGVLWGRNFDAQPGEQIYCKRIVLRWIFRMWLELSR